MTHWRDLPAPYRLTTEQIKDTLDNFPVWGKPAYAWATSYAGYLNVLHSYMAELEGRLDGRLEQWIPTGEPAYGLDGKSNKLWEREQIVKQIKQSWTKGRRLV